MSFASHTMKMTLASHSVDRTNGIERQKSNEKIKPFVNVMKHIID